LTVDSTKYVKTMALGSVQNLGIGTGGHSGLTVLDNYERTYGLKAASSKYAVVAYTSDTAVTVDPAHKYATGSNYISLKADDTTTGTSTITFAVVLKSAATTSTDYSSIDAYDSQSVTFTVIADKYVVGYGIDSVSTLYANPDDTTTSGTTISDSAYGTDGTDGTSSDRYAYASSVVVYGKTSSGTRVLLPTTVDGGSKSVLASVTSSNSDFAAKNGVSFEGDNTPEAVVFANAYTTSKTTSTGTLTAIINGVDGSLYTASTSLASSDADPVVTAVGFSSDVTTLKTVTDSTIGTVTLPSSDLKSSASDITNGYQVSKPIVHVVQGAKNGVNWSNFYFTAADQYNWGAAPVTVYAGVTTGLTATSSTAVPAALYFNPATGCLQTETVTADSTGTSTFDYSLYTGTLTLTAVSGSKTATVTLNLVTDATQTDTPTITTVPAAGTTSLTGTCVSGATVKVTVTNGSTSTDYAATVSTTTWTLTGLSLVAGDTISVTATASNYTESDAATASISNGITDAPTIDASSVVNGSTAITGTCVAGAVVTVTVNGTAYTVTYPTTTTWSATGTALTTGKYIIATAKSTGESVSTSATATVTAAGALSTLALSYNTISFVSGTAGTSTPTVAGKDASNNTVATTGTYTITGTPATSGVSIVAGTGAVSVASAAKSGTYAVTYTDTATSKTATATITVTAGPLTALTISYATSPAATALTASSVATLSAGLDANGNTVTTIPTGTFAITGTSLTGVAIDASTGLITLTSGATAGTYSVTYTVSGTVVGTVSVTVAA
jgi:hypothetical protein